jgi:hypothetical protein
MTRHDPKFSFQQMRDSVQETLSLTKGTQIWCLTLLVRHRGKSRADLEKNSVLNLALPRVLEVIGEGATPIPDDLRRKFLGFPWAQIIGLRNCGNFAYGRRL